MVVKSLKIFYDDVTKTIFSRSSRLTLLERVVFTVLQIGSSSLKSLLFYDIRRTKIGFHFWYLQFLYSIPSFLNFENGRDLRLFYYHTSRDLEQSCVKVS